MRRSLWKGIRSAALVVVGLVLLAAVVMPAVASTQARYIGVRRVHLDETYIWQGPNEIRAFIPTWSTAPGCLVTLAESDWAQPGQTVYCGNRNKDGTPGVFVAVFSPVEWPADFFLQLSVYQPGASYGQPIPCANLTDVC